MNIGTYPFGKLLVLTFTYTKENAAVAPSGLTLKLFDPHNQAVVTSLVPVDGTINVFTATIRCVVGGNWRGSVYTDVGDGEDYEEFSFTVNPPSNPLGLRS